MNSFVSGTEVRNYMINDELVDWLRLYYNKNDNLEEDEVEDEDKEENKKQNYDSFTSYIMEKGNEFEAKIINDFNNEMNTKIISVSPFYTEKAYNKTLELIRNRVPFIHSACIKNDSQKLFGVADLLIRSDFLGLFTKYEYKHDCQEPYHYVVLDIKWSTLHLTADQTHLVNSGNIPAYKAQLYIYNQCLKEMQKYEPKVAFLLGRRSECNSSGDKYDSPFDKIGVVDFNKKDATYTLKTGKAIKWVRKVREEGKKWRINPPSNFHLYPNMKVDSGKWQGIKMKIAKDIGDISLIWYCGIKQKEKAFDKGVFSFKDCRCNVNVLEIKGQRAKHISNILKINQQSEEKIRICSKQRLPSFSNEMFVDFETFCDIHDFEDDESDPLRRLNTIFLIGVWYQNQYYSFIAKDLKPSSELEIMEQFHEFVKSKNNPVLWYWHAENQLWDRSYNNQLDKNPEIFQFDFNWIDLKDIFIQNEIVIQDCFSYKLKEIINCLSNHGFISILNRSDKCKNGKDASLIALKLYFEHEKTGALSEYTLRASTVMKDVLKYNEFDVVSLHAILNFLKMIF